MFGISPFLVVALALAALLILWAVLTYNGLVKSRLRVDEAWSTTDIQLKRRASLVPNLAETVAGYASHERETLEEVTRARQQVQTAEGAQAAGAANAKLEQALGRLLVVVESYPDLKASTPFMALQAELSDLEAKIASARQFYNRCVLEYNTSVARLPSSLIARVANFTSCSFFELEGPVEEPRVRFTQGRPGA
jgi:LemA protein